MSDTSVIQMFLKWERETPQSIFLRQPVNGHWKTWTFKQAGNEIRRIISALKSLDLPPRSTISILSKNCAHWIMADLAILLADYVSVPLYANSTAASIKQLLEHSECKAIFIGKLDEYQNQKKGIPESVKKIGIDFYDVTEEITWSKWLADHEPVIEIVPRASHELLTIMYTSGTTGVPKGAMFNLKAFDYTSKILIEYLNSYGKIPEQPQLFSYLPLCHIAEKNLTEMLGVYTGASISFVESLDTFGRDLASVQPHLFFGVPRIWAKLQEKILEKMPQKKLNTLLKIPIVSSLVKNKIKKSLGLTRAGLKGTGAAPMPVSLLQWFNNLDILIREIYGMTENCALSHAVQDKIRFGTVGNVLKTVEVQYTDAGEILVKHEALMMGYYKEPELTREIITAEGFLRTGDLASVDSDGIVTITGRAKDQFKTDKAKYISPVPIEMKLLSCIDIDQTCVVGTGLPQPIALIVLSQGGKTKSKEEITKTLTALLATVNETLEHYEVIKKAIVLQDGWTVENGFMTPSLKIKRNEVERVNAPHYPVWYKRNGVVVWDE